MDIADDLVSILRAMTLDELLRHHENVAYWLDIATFLGKTTSFLMQDATVEEVVKFIQKSDPLRAKFFFDPDFRTKLGEYISGDFKITYNPNNQIMTVNHSGNLKPWKTLFGMMIPACLYKNLDTGKSKLMDLKCDQPFCSIDLYLDPHYTYQAQVLGPLDQPLLSCVNQKHTILTQKRVEPSLMRV